MYLAKLKTMLVTALKETFDTDYPVADFRNIRCSIEYPVEPQDYPGVWVDYEDTGPLQIAGIDHTENSDPDTDLAINRYTRWKYAGYASYTVVALTSLERDRLYDEMVRVIAFGKESTETRTFRQIVENNEFIAANFDFDRIQPRGNAAAPGTPWGTDEIIYERTLNMEVIGEFVSDAITGMLVPLSAIVLTEAKAVLPDDEYDEPVSSEDYSATNWH